MTLQSIDFNFFTKIMRGSCVFCYSNCIGFNLTSNLKNLLLFEICQREICEKFVYKYSVTIGFVKNEPTF